MDLALDFYKALQKADIVIDTPGLKIDDTLKNAVIISIYSDRRANSDDVLELNENPRGWFADSFNPVRNDKIGSRLWLLRRAKLINDTLIKAREYVLESLRWLIDVNTAQSTNVDTFIYNQYTLGIYIEIIKPSGTDVFNFQYAWDNL